MGVDFFPCDRCSETICDAGPWWTCEACNKRLCERCERATGASNDGPEFVDAERNPDCPFCTRAEATDAQLLAFVLAQLGCTRDKLMAEYREAKRENK